MKNYRIIEYKTVNGKFEFVDLGDSSYGEWIIYVDNKPKYHVNLFREKSESDAKIKMLIEKSNLSFEEILEKMGTENQIRLSLGKKPNFGIITKSEIKGLDLLPIPIEWIKK